MIKSVNIDGEDYIIRVCEECPFYSEALGDEYCSYPKGPHTRSLNSHEPYLEENCPLGMVEDCCTCKYEATKDEWVEPCCQCIVSWDSETGKESTPTKWEVKE